MLLEIHCHTSKYSKCSQVDPVSLVRQVVRKELQGLVITEHQRLWTDEELNELRRSAEVENHFLILSGQEVETDIGHVLVFGAPVTIPERRTIDELVRSFPEAAFVWAHPFRGGKIPADEALLDPRLSAVEIFSSNHTPKENYLGLAAWHRCKFTAVGGTDTHAKMTAGILPTQFDHPVTDIKSLAAELKAARCRPFFKEIPKSGSNIVVTEITLGTKGEDELRDRIILRKFSDEDKWKKMKSTLKITEELYARGFGDGSFRIPKLIEVNEDEKIAIEEGQRGKKLFDLLATVSPVSGGEYFRMAAKWLAKFHDSGLEAKDGEDALRREKKRMSSYLKSFEECRSPYLKEAKALVDIVEKREERLLGAAPGAFVLNHGDYHPKNIIIGHDRAHDMSTLFISVIDFDNAICLPRAFDVGYFLSQFRSQFFALPHVVGAYGEDDFIAAYMENSDLRGDEGMHGAIDLFKLRANLSIASFFIKVGKGTSPEMEDVLSRSIELAGKITREDK